MYRMLDLAYYTPNLVAVAQANGVQAIGGYVFDPFVADSGGYVGGWTPQVIGEIEAAGIAFIPIFTMQPFSGLVLTAQRCLEVLNAVPRNTNLVAIDVESGSDPGQAYANSWAVAMEAGGFTPILYGSQTTIQSSYVAAGEMKWVASYIRTAWDDSLNPLPGADGWQFAGSIDLGSGVVADLSNATFPIMATAPAVPPPPPPPEDEKEMIIMRVSATGGEYLVSGDLVEHVGDPADVAALTAAGVKVADGVSQAFVDGLMAASKALQGKITGSLAVSGQLTAS